MIISVLQSIEKYRTKKHANKTQPIVSQACYLNSNRFLILLEEHPPRWRKTNVVKLRQALVYTITRDTRTIAKGWCTRCVRLLADAACSPNSRAKSVNLTTLGARLS